jgi:hypothetical protein
MEHLSFDQSPYDLSISDHRDLSPSAFRAIQRSHDLCHFDRPLLQNLTSFTFKKQDFGGISLRDACVFLGPRLKTLDFAIPRPLVGLRTFVKALKAGCPAIEHLYISNCQSSDRVNRLVSDLVCGLSSLRTVRCGGITCHSQALEYLSSCPFLQDLHVHLPDELAQQRLLNVSSKILPFLAMRSLDITVASTTSVVEFFQVTSGSSDLESLSITIDSLPTAVQLHTALTVMQQSGICDKLTTFVLGGRVMSAEDSIPLHVLDAQTLLPLLQCRNLEDINIHISYGHAAIDNSLLKEMALAWPCLRTLFLFPCHFAHLWHAKADLRGLICLAQNCHSLESVGLQFDVSLPPTVIYPDKAIRCEWLTRLDVGRSHVTNPLAVATFLTDVFPNLTLIDHEYYIRSTPPGTSIRSDFEDGLSEDERSPEYIEMAKRCKDVVQILNARRQELSQSPTNCNVRMQPLICN